MKNGWTYLHVGMHHFEILQSAFQMAIWTQTDIDQLKVAIASGVQEVTFNGPPERKVRYQSLKEMRDLLASMEADVNSATVSNYALIQTNKGFYGCRD